MELVSWEALARFSFIEVLHIKVLTLLSFPPIRCDLRLIVALIIASHHIVGGGVSCVVALLDALTAVRLLLHNQRMILSSTAHMLVIQALVVDPLGAFVIVISRLLACLLIARSDTLLLLARTDVLVAFSLRTNEGFRWGHFLQSAWRVLVYHRANISICLELIHLEHLFAIQTGLPWLLHLLHLI